MGWAKRADSAASPGMPMPRGSTFTTFGEANGAASGGGCDCLLIGSADFDGPSHIPGPAPKPLRLGPV